MSKILRISMIGFALVVLLAQTTVVTAQQRKPATRVPKKTTPPPKPVAEKKPIPVAKPQAKSDAPAAVPVQHDVAPPPPPPIVPPVKTTKAPDEPLVPSQELLDANPAIRSALEMPRKEPRDFVRAMLLLIDLGHPEFAKSILAELMKAEVTDAQRVAIVSEF